MLMEPTMINTTLAAADSVILLSIYKPVLLLASMGGWAWIVSRLDKDMAVLFIHRKWINLAIFAAGALALLLWLVIPYFWLGLLVAWILLAGSVLGYVFYRNGRVDEADRWTFSTDILTRRIEQVQSAQAQRNASVHLMTNDGKRVEVPSGNTPAAAAHEKLEQLLEFALARGADRLDLAIAANQQVASVVHIDGVKYPQQGLDVPVAVAMIDYLKQIAGLDIEDRRRKQTGQLLAEVEGAGRHVLAITTAGSTRDLTLTMRLDPGKRARLGLDKLGLLESQRQQLITTLATGKRIILVASPPHQGQTTTLYALLHQHDPYTQSILTLEDEIAYEVEGVTHQNFDLAQDPNALNQTVGAMIRQDPQVFMLSRLPDSHVAKTIAQAAGELRFYVGLRQEDTFSALKVWMKAVGDPKLAASSLGAIISTRLVRKLCPTCRIAFKPDPDALRKLNLPDRITQLYKQSGQVMVRNKLEACPDCLGMAYRGRIGVFEVMALDQEARQLIAAQNIEQLRAHLRKQKMLWLQEAALAKVVDGTTSIAEIQRALAEKTA